MQTAPGPCTASKVTLRSAGSHSFLMKVNTRKMLKTCFNQCKEIYANSSYLIHHSFSVTLSKTQDEMFIAELAYMSICVAFLFFKLLCYKHKCEFLWNGQTSKVVQFIRSFQTDCPKLINNNHHRSYKKHAQITYQPSLHYLTHHR